MESRSFDHKPRQRQYAPRTRQGCIPCRLRRKRCPGFEPLCDACQRLNIECEWPPKRKVASRGTNVTIERQRSKNAQLHEIHQDQTLYVANATPPTSASSPSSSAPTSCQPVDDWHNVGEPIQPVTATIANSDEASVAENFICTPWPPASPTSIGYATQDDMDQRLIMSHYMHSFVPDISVANTSNYWTSVYIPLAFQCNGVKDAILSCASAHLSQTTLSWTRQARLLGLSCRHQLNCRQFIQNYLDNSQLVQQQPYELVQVVAASLLLITLEVLNGANTATWVNLLHDIRRIIQRYGGETAFISMSWEAKDLWYLFLYYDAMEFVVPGASPIQQVCDAEAFSSSNPSAMNPNIREELWPSGFAPNVTLLLDKGIPEPEADVGPTSSVDPSFGLAMQVFRIIKKINRLPQSQDNNLSRTNVFKALEQEISSIRFDCLHKEGTKSPQLDARVRLDLLTLAEINRLTVLILLFRRSSTQSYYLTELSRQILQLVERIPLGSSVDTGLTFGLFIAGGQLTSKDDRLQCHNRLIDICQRCKFLNTRLAEQILEEAWGTSEGQPKNWEDVIKQKGWSLNLA